jgi:hypothetical protein
MELPRGHDALDLDHPAYREVREENSRKAREIDELVHRVFHQNTDGRKLLSHLDRVLLRMGVGPGESGDRLRHIEGKRSLVLEFHQSIDRINGQDS